jgi:hypothetical protein
MSKWQAAHEPFALFLVLPLLSKGAFQPSDFCNGFTDTLSANANVPDISTPPFPCKPVYPSDKSKVTNTV